MTDLIRVLLVDDSATVVALFRAALEMDGRFEVVGEAGDGLEAMQIAKAEKPDIVLLVLTLPGIDGYDVIPELRDLSPDSRILVLSSRDVDEEALRAQGAHGHMSKDAPLDEAVERLVELCAGGASD